MIDRLLAEHERHSPRLPRDPRGAWGASGPEGMSKHTAWGGAVPTARQPRRRSPLFSFLPPVELPRKPPLLRVSELPLPKRGEMSEAACGLI